MGTEPTLFVVATPLGNLEDFSPRAQRILREVAVVFAEDTRRTHNLLSHFGISTPLASLHEHNERARIQAVSDRLARGESVALVSDAGTPVVSDPGAELVRTIGEAGYRVSPIAGPSALSAALSVAGFVANDVRFLGFLPVKGSERERAIERVAAHRGVVVLYEAPHRIDATLRELAVHEPERPLVVGRELTKLHEEVRRGTVASLAEWASGEVLGELTLVLGPTRREEVPKSEEDIDAALRKCLDAGLSKRDAVAAVAALLEWPKREVYERANALPGAKTP